MADEEDQDEEDVEDEDGEAAQVAAGEGWSEGAAEEQKAHEIIEDESENGDCLQIGRICSICEKKLPGGLSFLKAVHFMNCMMTRG